MGLCRVIPCSTSDDYHYLEFIIPCSIQPFLHDTMCLEPPGVPLLLQDHWLDRRHWPHANLGENIGGVRLCIYKHITKGGVKNFSALGEGGGVGGGGGWGSHSLVDFLAAQKPFLFLKEAPKQTLYSLLT